MEKVVLWMRIPEPPTEGLATLGGTRCWALPAPLARRGCDPGVGLGTKLKSSQPEVVVLGSREFFFIRLLLQQIEGPAGGSVVVPDTLPH